MNNIGKMKVSMRGGFSDRNAIKPENTAMQVLSFDKRTRIQLHNMIARLFEQLYGGVYSDSVYHQEFARYVLETIYSQPIEAGIRCDVYNVMKAMQNTILKGDYDDVLTLIEAVIAYWEDELKIDWGEYENFKLKFGVKSIAEYANRVFEREYIGYRFINNEISLICDENEMKAVEEAIVNPYDSVREHIRKANRYLSDRNKPDYENSIKESITAVESICTIITEAKGKEATLGNALKKVEERGIAIHGGLKSAFEKLYGYTSDANGIRHTGDIGGPNSTFEEAKFMIVACSAFVNYLFSLSKD